MKRPAYIFFFGQVFSAVNLGAQSFVPLANKERAPFDDLPKSFGGNAMPTTKAGLLRVNSSLSAANLEPTSTDEIVGPELPLLESSSKRLFLVRHGEVINPGGDRPVYYGALDVSLSPLGEAEAEAAAMYLQQFDLDLVVSSPLSRAIYGAEQVLASQKDTEAAVVKMDGFKELDRGSWCGLTKEEIGVEAMAKFDACDESATPEGGESYNFLKNRVLEDRDKVLERLPAGGTAAIVSHLQVTRSMLSEALGIPTAEMAGLGIATASVTCIDYAADGTQTVHFQSFKPDVGLEKSKDGAN
mmetsp:Transcript_456/g.935  ORF Transcript_456/g.935 Transcript_456/m.935 type:complete len:300 (-) Transcript_456:8-907(-)